MPLLDAALAFALTMFVVSTVVMQIVDLLRKFFKLRQDQLQEMLKDYVVGELQPVLKREFERLGSKLKDGAVNELSGLATKLSEQLKSLDDEQVKTGDRKVQKTKRTKYLADTQLFTPGELKSLVYVSTEELEERLKRSILGGKLLETLGDEAGAIFDALGRRWDVVGEKFTELFRTKSRWIATIVAFALALGLNIDTVHIVNTYISDENVRTGIIAQRDTFVGEYQTLADSLEKDANKKTITREEFNAAFGKTRSSIDSLDELGFPIGWSYFPHSMLWEGNENGPEQAGQANNRGKKDLAWRWAVWVLGVVLTGLLAGLGAPFWFDAVNGIWNLSQRARPGVKAPAKTKASVSITRK